MFNCNITIFLRFGVSNAEALGLFLKVLTHHYKTNLNVRKITEMTG